jgi:hypothetical protein
MLREIAEAKHEPGIWEWSKRQEISWRQCYLGKDRVDELRRCPDIGGGGEGAPDGREPPAERPVKRSGGGEAEGRGDGRCGSRHVLSSALRVVVVIARPSSSPLPPTSSFPFFYF